VRLWDPDKLASTKTLAGLTDYVYAVAFRPDGKQVAAGGYEGVVKVWNVADGKVAHTFVAAPGSNGK
jgi:WD40 repeat protein